MVDLLFRIKLATFFASISDSGVLPQKVSLHGLLEAPMAEKNRGNPSVMTSKEFV